MTAPPLPKKNTQSTFELPPLPKKDNNAVVVGSVFIPPDAIVPPPLPKKDVVLSTSNQTGETQHSNKSTDSSNLKPTSNVSSPIISNTNDSKIPRKTVSPPTKNTVIPRKEARPLPVPKSNNSFIAPSKTSHSNKSSAEQNQTNAKLASSIEDLWAQCSVDESTHTDSSSAFNIQEVSTVSHLKDTELQKTENPPLLKKPSEIESMWQSFMEIHNDVPSSETITDSPSPFFDSSEKPTLTISQPSQEISENIIPPQLPSRSSKPLTSSAPPLPPLPLKENKTISFEFKYEEPPKLPPKQNMNDISRRKSQDFTSGGFGVVRTRSSSDPDKVAPDLASGNGWASGKREVAAVNYGEKSAFLEIHEGILGQWKRRWCVIEGGNLKIYMNQDDAHPFKIWNLQEYDLTLAPTLKKYSFHLGKLKKHHYVRCQTQTELDDWMNSIGKFTKEVVIETTPEPVNIVIPKFIKPLPEKKVAVVQKVGSSCSASVVSTELHEENKRDVFTSYTVSVMFKLPGQDKAQKWLIFRRFSQFQEFHTHMVSGGIKLTEPFPEKTSSKNYHPDFVEKRRIELNAVLQELTTHCDAIMASKKLTFHFCKFMFPVQHGDRKPSDFVMPFPIELE